MPNTEANKSTVRDFVEKVFNDHNPELAREYLAPEAKWHGGILGRSRVARTSPDCCAFFWRVSRPARI